MNGSHGDIPAGQKDVQLSVPSTASGDDAKHQPRDKIFLFKELVLKPSGMATLVTSWKAEIMLFVFKFDGKSPK